MAAAPRSATRPLWPVRSFLFSLVLACLLPGAVGAGLLIAYEYQRARGELDRNQVQTARAMMQVIDSQLDRGIATAQALAMSDLLTRGEFARFHVRARAALRAAGLGTNIVLRDRAGRQLLNSALPYAGPVAVAPAPGQVAPVFDLAQPQVSDLFTGPVQQRPVVSVDVPVLRDGKVWYALGIGMLPEQFGYLLPARGAGAHALVVVTDGSGAVVAHNDGKAALLGMRLPEAVRAGIAAARAGVLDGKGFDGQASYHYFAHSELSPWAVSIIVPVTAGEQAFARPLHLLILGVAALFAAGLLLAWQFGGRIARAVVSLINPAIALGEGRALQLAPLAVREAEAVSWAMQRAARLLEERAAAVRWRDAELAEAHRLARFGTWSWELASGAVACSPSVREIFGRDVPDFGKQRGTLLPVATWEQVQAAAAEVVRTGIGFDLELEINHGANHDRRIWIRAKCEAVRDDTGQVVALRGTLQDITPIKERQQALRHSDREAREAARRAEEERSRLDAVLDAVPVGMFVADARGGILQVNAEGRALWGEGAPMSRSVADYEAWNGWWADGGEHQGRRLRAHEWAMARALAGIEVHRHLLEIETYHEPPRRRIILSSGAPVRAADGRILGGVVAQMDITGRVRAEQALLQAQRRKDEFLAMLAHELRNPLAPISAAAEVLAMGRADPERVRRTSAIIARQVRHLTALVEDLLDVSRVTRGLVTLDRRPIDANRVIADAIEQVRPLIEARHHHLTVRRAARPEPILGDQKRLVQVVTNLLNNAAKFTPDGGRIELSVEECGDEVCLIVSDNGIGMTPELARSAFELFAQGERAADRSASGLGIGLALVKSLVGMHGGTVCAASAGPGQGSRFVVRLPRGATGARHAGDAGAGGAGAAVPAATGTPVSDDATATDASSVAAPAATSADVTGVARAPLRAPRRRVLVVDDNADAAQTLAMVVEALGHEALVEYGSQAALERARREHPDACLLDIGLPEMDGNELARQLRALPGMARATLVAVTGYGQEQERQRAMSAGFDRHLIKPVGLEQIAAALGWAASAA